MRVAIYHELDGDVMALSFPTLTAAARFLGVDSAKVRAGVESGQWIEYTSWFADELVPDAGVDDVTALDRAFSLFPVERSLRSFPETIQGWPRERVYEAWKASNRFTRGMRKKKGGR